MRIESTPQSENGGLPKPDVGMGGRLKNMLAAFALMLKGEPSIPKDPREKEPGHSQPFDERK